MKLRDYQHKACERIYKGWLTYDSLLVAMATGTGKTAVIGGCADAWCGKSFKNANGISLGDRVLMLAHRDELIWQLVEGAEKWTGDRPAIEKAELRSDEKSLFNDRARIVVSSVQTMMSGDRRDKFRPEDFGLVIIDEAHHSVAPTYLEVLEHFCKGGAKVLGMTATADRDDEVSLGKVFDAVAFEYDLLTAIKAGWLCNVKQKLIHVEGLDWSDAQAKNDLSQEKIARIIEEEEMLHKMAVPAIEAAGDRQTIIFAPSVHVCKELAEIINRYKPHSALAVSGKTDEDDRREIVKSYKRGEVQYLVNCMLLTEGFDAPATSCVIMFRPTQSRSLYAQMAGRGFRGGKKCPVVGKENLLLVDFVGNSKHKLITSLDLLGGKFDDLVVEEATNNANERSGESEEPLDPLEILEEVSEHADELRRRQREAVRARALVKKKDIDPFDLLDIPDRKMPGFYNGRPATEAQVALLEKNGVKGAKKMSFWKAHQVCEQLVERRKAGLCSYKQARRLAGFGFDTSVTFEEASTILDRLYKGSGKPWENFTPEDWKRLNDKKKKAKAEAEKAAEAEAQQWEEDHVREQDKKVHGQPKLFE